MEKYKNIEIKKFEFAQISDPSEGSESTPKNFEFKAFDIESVKSSKIPQEQIRLERKMASQGHFQLDEMVKDFRGISAQEQNDFEQKVSNEVEARVELIKKQAYEAGILIGKEDGKNEALSNFEKELNLKLSQLDEIIATVKSSSEKLIDQNRSEIYEFVKRFTKWVLLKEVNNKVYIEGLLEKLILELNSRKNLIVKVGQSNFNEMPEVIKTIESKLGQLQNVRVELVPELNYPGIILEAENGLIDGSLEGVFEKIDKIFQQVVGHG
jgi:flagellar assembly protein FliH